MSGEQELQPVLLSTIDRELMLAAGTAASWASMDGFPAAGKGVAVLSDVENWAAGAGLIAGVDSPAVAADPVVVADPKSEIFFSEAHPEPAETPARLAAELETEIDWIEIKVPVVRGTKTVLAARSVQTFSVRPTDLAVRHGWGDLLAGCRAAGIKLDDQKPADDFSKVFRLIGEQLAGKNE